jgi:hypothetical protein
MDPAIVDAMEIFYKLKGQYDKNLNKIKQRIIGKDDLSMDEKRDLFLAQKPKCIVCKKPVGTIFKTEPNKLVAMCGAHNIIGESEKIEPCKLNIQIVKGDMVYLPDYTKRLREKHNEIVSEIIKVKYNLLFKYTTEDKTVEDFENVKSKLDETGGLFDKYVTRLIDITHLLSKQEKIAITDLQIFEFVNEMKEMIREAIATNEEQLLRDAIEIYVTRIMDILKENRRLKYSYEAIEIHGDRGNETHNLVQLPYTIYDLESVVGDSFKIESLVIKK